MITTCMSYLAKRGPEHGAATENSPGEFGRGHKEGSNTSPHVLPTSQNPSCWNPSLLRDAWATSKDHELDQMCAKWGDWPETPGNQSHYHNPWDCESCSRGVLLGFIILPGYPFPLKGVPLVYTCYVSLWVSSDNSSPHVRQDPLSGPRRGSPFLQHSDTKASHDIFLLIFNGLLMMWAFCLALLWSGTTWGMDYKHGF